MHRFGHHAYAADESLSLGTKRMAISVEAAVVPAAGCNLTDRWRQFGATTAGDGRMPDSRRRSNRGKRAQAEDDRRKE